MCIRDREEDLVDYMIANIGVGDVVTAGAWCGDLLPALSHVCRGTVWAFEPNLENWQCATITVRLNELGNVQLYHAALGATVGFGTLITHDDRGLGLGGASMLTDSRYTDLEPLKSSWRKEQTPMVTIDATVPSDSVVSIVQLDVESYEEPVLLGGLETVRRCSPIIIVEESIGVDWWAEHAPGYHAIPGVGGFNSVFRRD